MRRLLGAGILLFAHLGGAQAAQTWADTAGNDPKFATSKAICIKARSVQLPKSSGASAAADCDSSDLLYGIGHPADPIAARVCAEHELVAEDQKPMSGAAILATIYANGSGVVRNLDVAIAYACRIDGAPFESDGWVTHLARLRANGPDAKPFDICDDITSGMMEGACAERAGALADVARKSGTSRLATSLAPPARTAFDKLQAAEQAFVKTSADNEVDMTGTGRVAFVIDSQQQHDDAFATTLHKVLDGKLPNVGATGAADADKKLNATYAKLMALKDTSTFGTVTKGGIRDAQRVWLAYRDAFVAFASVAKPGVAPDSLVADLTQARTKELGALLGS